MQLFAIPQEPSPALMAQGWVELRLSVLPICTEVLAKQQEPHPLEENAAFCIFVFGVGGFLNLCSSISYCFTRSLWFYLTFLK